MTHQLNSPNFLLQHFESCEPVVLHVILLEVARELSGLCKIARRSKLVGPRWYTISYLECCKCARTKSHCANGLVVELRIRAIASKCAYAHLRWSAGYHDNDKLTLAVTYARPGNNQIRYSATIFS